MMYMETDVESQNARVVIQPGAQTRDLAHAVAATLRAHRVSVDEFMMHLHKEAAR